MAGEEGLRDGASGKDRRGWRWKWRERPKGKGMGRVGKREVIDSQNHAPMTQNKIRRLWTVLLVG